MRPFFVVVTYLINRATEDPLTLIVQKMDQNIKAVASNNFGLIFSA
mgnify:CR=1 FL=1